MAAGRAIVASAVGGVPRAVEDLVTGLLVPPSDSSALASAICRLLNDTELRASMGTAARNRFDREYTSHAGLAQQHEECRGAQSR